MEDAGLWEELEALYAAAGSDPASFRRLERGAARTSGELRAYYREVARDYVEKLERRLSRHGARALDGEERALLRAWLGVAPFDEERERRLVDDLGALGSAVERLRAERGAPLSPEAIDRMTDLLAACSAHARAVAEALEAKEAVRELDEQLGTGGRPPERDAILQRIRKLLLGSGEAKEPG